MCRLNAFTDAEFDLVMPSTWNVYNTLHVQGVSLKSALVPLTDILACIDTWLLSGKGSGAAFACMADALCMLPAPCSLLFAICMACSEPKECACR